MRRALGLVLAALLLVAGCSGGASNAFKNPHGTLHVKKGDEFRIEFVVNSGVGFDWVMIPRLERSILTAPTITTFYPDENRAGQSGTKRFTFRASATGTETVIFQHVFRGKPQERRVLTVDVSK